MFTVGSWPPCYQIQRGEMNMKRIALAVLATLTFIPTLCADSAPPNTIEEVTFSATWISVSGTTETISGSFEWNDNPNDVGLLPGTMQASGSGFLGNVVGAEFQSNVVFIPFIFSTGDDMYLYLSADLDADLFNILECVSAQCDNAFGADAGFAGKSPDSSSFTFNAVPTPEPSGFALTLLGLVPLALITWRSRPS